MCPIDWRYFYLLAYLGLGSGFDGVNGDDGWRCSRSIARKVARNCNYVDIDIWQKSNGVQDELLTKMVNSIQRSNWSKFQKKTQKFTNSRNFDQRSQGIDKIDQNIAKCDVLCLTWEERMFTWVPVIRNRKIFAEAFITRSKLLKLIVIVTHNGVMNISLFSWQILILLKVLNSNKVSAILPKLQDR